MNNTSALYISAKEATCILDISQQALQKQIEKGRLPAQPVQNGIGRGGMSYRLPLDAVLKSATPERRLLYYARDREKEIDYAALISYRESFPEEEQEAAIATLLMRQEAAQRVEGILQERHHTNVMQTLEEAADFYDTTTRTLRRWHARYQERGLAGLMDKRERKDKGIPKTMCQLTMDYIERNICFENKVPQNLIREQLNEVACLMGDGACDVCPYCKWSDARQGLKPEELQDYPECERATGRMIVPNTRDAINRFVKTIPAQQKAYGRWGSRYWEAHFMQKTKREKPERINECWFADHHEFDVFVIDEDGRFVRPWLTALMDATSGVFVGVALTLNPNADTIAESFARASLYTTGSPVVGLPKTIYMDNGKDYRSHLFEGAEGTEVEYGRLNADFYNKRGMLQSLGVRVTRAIPYRAWSKTIERAFGVLERRWMRLMPGWCGYNHENRPQDFGKKLKKMAASGDLMTFETFARVFLEDILPAYHAFKGENGRAQSPMEIYLHGDKARSDIPSPEMMTILKSQKAIRAVGTQGIRYANALYWHPALADYINCGRHVTVIANRGYNPSITVMDGSRFVCEAEPLERMRLSDEDQDRIARHMEAQGQQRRKITDRLERVRQATKHITRPMYVEALDEQRNRAGATMISLEAERAARAKDNATERRSGRAKAAEAGADKVREMMRAMGEKLLNEGEWWQPGKTGTYKNMGGTNMDNKATGARIRYVRDELGLTQAEMAKKLRIGRSTISNMEVGLKPAGEQTIRLMHHELGVREEWLRTGEGEAFGKMTKLEMLITELTLQCGAFYARLNELMKDNIENVHPLIRELRKLLQEESKEA